MSEFKKELEKLITGYSIDNETGTPDFLLAEYLMSCIDALGVLMMKRKKLSDPEPVQVDGELNIINRS